MNQILGVSLAIAESNNLGRYVHFYSSFIAFRLFTAGYPLPSLTQKIVLLRKFSPIIDYSLTEFHFQKTSILTGFFQNVDSTTEKKLKFSYGEYF
jgi:hypothetical protein